VADPFNDFRPASARLTQLYFAHDKLPDLTFFGADGATTLALRESEAQIAALAADLSQRFPRGARVGLLYRSEPALPSMWLAALHAGLEPLILQYPTEKQSLAAWRFSIDYAVRGARLSGLLCSPELKRLDINAYNPLFQSGQVPTGSRAPSRLGALSGDAAVLQMSSGTTGQRKAIRFTLRQLARHAHDYNATLGLDATDSIVSWLPLYHDMGFVACFVMPLLLGVPVAMIDPIDWVRRPRSLFDVIESAGGTLCFLPNFGFEVMARHADGRRFPAMRRWISCSEPAYASTLERFAAATATPPSQLSVCYAMAENVFAVSSTTASRPSNATRAPS
jgi:acyl-CoA synthetase (AMP-forming)/AMP-acid ligase II